MGVEECNITLKETGTKSKKKEILISCIWGLSVTNANKKKSQKSMIHAILEGSLKSLASWGGVQFTVGGGADRVFGDIFWWFMF